ncbi:MAG TPA: RDD family protein [Acidimicrobiia bacterium]|nr:RDD family protein [Acidimicrobiia bacterium]
MHLDDRLTIETPEGVSIDVTLAGLGSRFGAAAVDLLIQGILLLAVLLALSLAGSAVSNDLGVFLMGLGTLIIATVVIGYYIVFEALNGGRTPGKAAFGLRVGTVDGSALSLSAVLLRTLMRLVDFLPAAYAVGAISIVATRRNQRLGDLVANTVVIRDRVGRSAMRPQDATPVEGWDASTVSQQEVALVRRFVERRSGLTSEARSRLAAELAGRIRPKVGGGGALGDEEFLVQLLAEKLSRER